MPETVHYTENSRPFRRELVPELIYDANPALVDFYYLAWKQAWEHIYETESLPFSPYIGEGCKRDRIWIWDSCLMGTFCRYAADVYPVCSTLDCRLLAPLAHVTLLLGTRLSLCTANRRYP